MEQNPGTSLYSDGEPVSKDHLLPRTNLSFGPSHIYFAGNPSPQTIPWKFIVLYHIDFIWLVIRNRSHTIITIIYSKEHVSLIKNYMGFTVGQTLVQIDPLQIGS